jgi:DNA-directed RNA polymerase subunit RPC12/RpoP
MSITKCPGQDTMFWRPGDIFEITCPQCGQGVEFYKDDAKRRCPGCDHIFVNPKLDQGCAQWCQFADKCLGLNRDEETGELLE